MNKAVVMVRMFLLLVVILFLRQEAQSQAQIPIIQPFNFTIQAGQPIEMLKDTSGAIWFAAADSVSDSLHFINEDHTISFAVAIGYTPSVSTLIDSRNDFWILEGDESPLLIRNKVTVPYSNPGLVNSDSIQYFLNYIANDHKSDDYFIYDRENFSAPPHTPDSFYLTKFDGVNFTNYNLNALGFQIKYGDLGLPQNRALCDYNGNLYLVLDSADMLKFDGSHFSLMPYPYFNEEGSVLFFDYSNNLYLRGDTHIYNVLPNGQLSVIAQMDAGLIHNANLFLAKDSSVWVFDESNYVYFKYNGSSFEEIINLYTIPILNECFILSGASIFDSVGNILQLTVINTPACASVVCFGLPGFNLIDGTVFEDMNADGIQDSGEVGIPNLNIIQLPDSYVANTDSMGKYGVLTGDTNVTHMLSLVIPDYYYATTQVVDTVNADTGNICCFNIGLAPNGNIQDLQITISSLPTSPGQDSYQWLSYTNTGTTTVSDTIQYFLDPRNTFVYSLPAPDVVSNNMLKWGYASLRPFEIRGITIDLHTDSDVQANSVLSSTAIINPLASDTTPSNNIFNEQQQVLASFDPNEKTVSPSSPISSGQELTYTIFFQNTGTAAAGKIVVRDTLKYGFNLSSFKILGSSFPVVCKFKGSGIIEFDFNNINLPDSSVSQLNSLGYVKYCIRTLDSISWGADITNKAFIYFDYNSPVATNTTNSYVGTTSIKPANAELHFTVYPNPSSGDFFIDFLDYTQTDQIVLVDMTGRRILATATDKNLLSVSCRNLASGIYLLNILKQGVIVGRSKILVQK